MEHFGKILLFTGLVIVAIGALVILLGHLGFFKLPGDLEFGGKNWKIYVPIATCVLLSALLTIILWIAQLFRR